MQCPLCKANECLHSINTELFEGTWDPASVHCGFLEAHLCPKVDEVPCPGTTLLLLVLRQQRSCVFFPSEHPISVLSLIFIPLGCIRDGQPKSCITVLVYNVQTWDETTELALKWLLSRKSVHPGRKKEKNSQNKDVLHTVWLSWVSSGAVDIQGSYLGCYLGSWQQGRLSTWGLINIGVRGA